LSGLQTVQIGGDLKLMGIPAERLPEGLQVGGKVWLSRSQHALIRQAVRRVLDVHIVDDASRAFEPPADAFRWLSTAKHFALPTHDELSASWLKLDDEARARLSNLLDARLRGAGGEGEGDARAAAQILLAAEPGRLRKLEDELLASPASAWGRLPTPTLELLTHRVPRDKATTLAKILIDRARSGEAVELRWTAWLDPRFWSRESDPRSGFEPAIREAVFEVLAAEAVGVRSEKRLPVFLLRNGSEIDFTDLFDGALGYPAILEELGWARVRHPESEPLSALWSALVDRKMSRSHGIIVLVEKSVPVLRTSSPDLAAALAGSGSHDRLSRDERNAVAWLSARRSRDRAELERALAALRGSGRSNLSNDRSAHRVVRDRSRRARSFDRRILECT
jgi:hypothetical protein